MPNHIPQQLHHFTFPPEAQEGSNFFTQTLAIFLTAMLMDGYKVISPCSFDLHFPND